MKLAHNGPMKPVKPSMLVALIGLIVIGLPACLIWIYQPPPDFRDFPAGDERKTAFFAYLGPIIDAENERWLKKRARLKSLRNSELSKRDRLWLDQLSAFFNLPGNLNTAERISRLLTHVGQVPRSLALAQAAKESAWGTSRFAREGNNYFGQRCYSKGCGMVPDGRRAGAKFEVRSFPTVRDSVASYMNNINSHAEYAGLRTYRASQRDAGKGVSGIRAAEKITQYSERRDAYVDEIQALIHFNQLESGAGSRRSSEQESAQ